MGYKKILVDNVVCSRRFHITCDPESQPYPKVKLDCPFCGITIFEAEEHPEVQLARQENLVQTSELSDNVIRSCDYEDEFSKRTQPQKKDGSSTLPVN